MKHLDIPARVRGFLHFELIDRAGKVRQSGTSDNLILDSGLNYIMATGLDNLCSYLAVGTGSTAPAANQTALVAEIARTNQNLSLTSGTGDTRLGPGRFQRVFGVAFDYAQANGNLTEFGGGASSSGTLNTRALFKDANGNPIVISKTSDTRLVIYYTIEIQINPVIETAGIVDISGIGEVSCTYIMTDNGSQPLIGYGSYSLFSISSSMKLQHYTSAAPNMAQEDTSGGNSAYGGRETYVSGSFSRVVSGERPPELNSATIYGYNAGIYVADAHQNNKSAIKIKFNNPIAKNKDYRLKLSVSYSISR